MGVQMDEARGRPAEENEEALREAAHDGETAQVRVLLAAGTDPDAADEDGRTALYYAANNGREEAVGALAGSETCSVTSRGAGLLSDHFNSRLSGDT